MIFSSLSNIRRKVLTIEPTSQSTTMVSPTGSAPLEVVEAEADVVVETDVQAEVYVVLVEDMDPS